jgi:hypothetical protein
MVVRSLTAAALLATAACYSVRPVVNAKEFIPANRPERVWVVNQSNESYVLNSPRVEGDNIVGRLLNSSEEMTIPLGSAQLVEAKQKDKGKTILVGVVLAAVAGTTVYLVASGGSTPGDSQDYDNGMQP